MKWCVIINSILQRRWRQMKKQTEHEERSRVFNVKKEFNLMQHDSGTEEKKLTHPKQDM